MRHLRIPLEKIDRKELEAWELDTCGGDPRRVMMNRFYGRFPEPCDEDCDYERCEGYKMAHAHGDALFMEQARNEGLDDWEWA